MFFSEVPKRCPKQTNMTKISQKINKSEVNPKAVKQTKNSQEVERYLKIGKLDNIPLRSHTNGQTICEY